MADIVLSAALADIREAMRLAASGGAGLVMSARSAAEFIEALGICEVGALALEQELAVRKPAMAAALDMAEARAAELQALTRRMAARIARLRPRELPVELIAAQTSLPPGERSILPFPVVARPRPITEADMIEAMAAIGEAIGAPRPIDALEGDRPSVDPLGRDRAEDGA